MNIDVREVSEFVITEDRYRWFRDEDIDRYIGFSEDFKIGDVQTLNPAMEHHFEVYLDDRHVGDFRCQFNSDEDKKLQRAEFFIIVGVRNAGVGSQVFPALIEASKKYYKQLYCTVHKSNFRSVKLMKKNGFYVDDMDNAELLLKLDLK